MMDPRRRNMAHRFPGPSDPIWNDRILNPPDDPDPRDLKPQTADDGVYRATRNPVPGRPWKRYFRTMLDVAVLVAFGTWVFVNAVEWAVDTFLLRGVR